MKKYMIQLAAFLLALLTVFTCVSLGEFTVSAASSRELLDSAPLKPMKTGFDEADTFVDKLFDKIFTPGMSVYEKTKACYDYVVFDTVYDSCEDLDGDRELLSKYGYKSRRDAFVIFFGYQFLMTKTGYYDDFAAAFALLTRAIGLESYYVKGKTNTTGGGYSEHSWVIISLGGKYYAFDPQVEANITQRSSSGKNGYSRFCVSEASMASKLIYDDREADINAYGNYECFQKFSASFVCPSAAKPIVIGSEMVFTFETKNAAGMVFGNLYINEGHAAEISDLSQAKAILESSTVGKKVKWTPTEEGDFTLYIAASDSYGRSEYKAVRYTFTAPHVWGNATVKTAATCTQAGVMEYTCSHCDITKTESIKPKGHKWYQKTETLDGEYTVKTCAVCGEKAIIGVKEGCTAEKLKSRFLLDGKDVKSVETTGKAFGTGSRVVTEKAIYNVVINGDTNGDGVVNSTDYLQIKSAFLRKYALSNVDFLAADTDGDGKITSTDYLQIKSHFLKVFDLYA